LGLDDSDAVGVSGHVKVGDGKIKAQYLVGDSPIISASALGFEPGVKIAGGDNEVTQFSVGYEHAMSKQTIAHVGFTSYEEDETEVEEDAFFAGLIHSF
jgi:predicted porin